MRIISFLTKILTFLPGEISHYFALKSIKYLHLIGILHFFGFVEKDNKNFFGITVIDNKDDIISLRNISRNYHDNFIIRKNNQKLFVQKNSKKFNISRQIASEVNLKNFLKDLKNDKQNFVSQNIDICVQVHKIINKIVHK